MNTKKKEDYADLSGMSAIHKAALERAGQSWQEANAKGDQKGMDAAHAAAESIRGLYGYSGGEDGSQYVSTQTAPKTASKSAPSYTNRYQSVMDQAANALLNRKAFTYDSANDPMYQQYKDSYTRQGQQAMENTLAQVSARTGGLASSYAGTAAQQAYNGYMSALADKVPELRQLAYQMYMDEGDTMRQNLSMLQGLENTAYGRYRDSVADNQWQQTFDYNAAQDALAQNNYLAELAYQKERDKLSDQRYGQERADEKAMAAAQLLGQAGDYSKYKELLGLSDEQVAALVKQFQEQNAPKVTGGGGGYTPKPSTPDYEGLFAAAQASGYPKSYIANNYKDFGFTSSTGLYDEFSEWDSGADGMWSGNRTSLGWDEDEGIFTWNGKNYHEVEALLADIEGAGLSEQEMEMLKSKFARYGFNLS